jgi:hypothetical protein
MGKDSAGNQLLGEDSSNRIYFIQKLAELILGFFAIEQTQPKRRDCRLSNVTNAANGRHSLCKDALNESARQARGAGDEKWRSAMAGGRFRERTGIVGIDRKHRLDGKT